MLSSFFNDIFEEIFHLDSGFGNSISTPAA